jgi:hypothetical protein
MQSAARLTLRAHLNPNGNKLHLRRTKPLHGLNQTFDKISYAVTDQLYHGALDHLLFKAST